MLEFLRKYQSYIYIVVTTVIVISFSFFGTASTLVSNPIRDQIVFTAVDGSSIKRSDLDEMVVFISTDSFDKLLFGGIWGPNFLNDGIIRKDLLTTGVGQLLAKEYIADLENDLNSRHQKEQAYVPYVHPQAGFITADQVWSNYAPAIKSNLEILKAAPSATTPAAINARVNLYLAHSQFPPQFLGQVLAHQEKQFSFVGHDANLDRTDLSVFGYHRLEDWFGPRFVRLAAEFIINGAKIAEEKGYEVSKEEALADLLRNAQISYEQMASNPNLAVANIGDYYNEQLRQMGMDQSQAVKVWRQVLLYRRLANDIGNTVFVDPLLYTQFSGYAKEAVAGDQYKLPRELHFSNYRSLQKHELYLNQISKRSDSNLMPPKTFFSEAEVARKNPRLVQKLYLLKVASIDKNALQAKISLRDTWNWEVNHWDALTKQFPELGVKNAQTRDDRFAALDSLDDQTRLRVDTYARSAIVDENPEWKTEALNKAAEKTLTIGLSSGVPSSYFQGLTDGDDLIKKLDKNDELANFTADDRTFYKITVLDKSSKPVILTFAEANQQGILDEALDHELASYYERNRETHSWGSFEDVQSEVADLYFAKTLQAIENEYGKKEETKGNGNLLAPLRFYGYLNEIRTKAEKDPSTIAEYVGEALKKDDAAKLADRGSLADQWKLIKVEARIHRGDPSSDETIFSAEPKTWSKVIASPNGDLSLIYIQNKDEVALDPVAAAQKLGQIKQLLSAEAQQNYMAQLIETIKAKNAISLSYLNQPVETMEIPEAGQEELE